MAEIANLLVEKALLERMKVDAGANIVPGVSEMVRLSWLITLNFIDFNLLKVEEELRKLGAWKQPHIIDVFFCDVETI